MEVNKSDADRDLDEWEKSTGYKVYRSGTSKTGFKYVSKNGKSNYTARLPGLLPSQSGFETPHKAAKHVAETLHNEREEIVPKEISVAQAQKLRQFMEENRSVREAERLGMTSRVNKAIQKSHKKVRDIQQQRLAAQNLQEQQRLAIQQQTERNNLTFQRQADQQRLAVQLKNTFEQLLRTGYNNAVMREIALGASEADASMAGAAAVRNIITQVRNAQEARRDGLDEAIIALEQQVNDKDTALHNFAGRMLADPYFSQLLEDKTYIGGSKRKKKSKKIKSYKRKTLKKIKKKQTKKVNKKR